MKAAKREHKWVVSLHRAVQEADLIDAFDSDCAKYGGVRAAKVRQRVLFPCPVTPVKPSDHPWRMVEGKIYEAEARHASVNSTVVLVAFKKPRGCNFYNTPLRSLDDTTANRKARLVGDDNGLWLIGVPKSLIFRPPGARSNRN